MYLRILTAFLIAVCGFVYASGQTLPAEAEPEKGYLVGPADEITVKVLGEPQFDFVATVDENGKIEVPFVEKPIQAKCLSERDLRDQVTKHLSKYLKSPQITLRVTARKSRPPVSLYGEVRVQQQYMLTRRAYLLELITVAGGETEKSGGMITVIRTRPPMCGEPAQTAAWKVASEGGIGAPSTTYSISSLKQGTEATNPEIFPGDVILVHKAAQVYITGEVIKPGELHIPETGLPLTQAVAMAHGITRDAKTKNVTIRRRKSGSPEPELIAVNFDQIKKGQQKDVMLQPFDIVVVDKARKSVTDIFYEVLIGLPNRIPIIPF